MSDAERLKPPEAAIRVELGEEVRRHGKWRWRCWQWPLEGVSRQPLLDACREIKRMGGDPQHRVGLCRAGRLEPDLTCTVGWGASKTVDEEGPWFKKFQPGPAERAKQKKEAKP